jgi:hypothetical protein
MSNESTPATAPAAAVSPTVAMFQKAHAKIVTLQRVEEQLNTLLEQRKRLQDELREVQTQINDEINRVVHQAEDASERVTEAFKESPTQAKPNRRKAAGEPIQMEVEAM